MTLIDYLCDTMTVDDLMIILGLVLLAYMIVIGIVIWKGGDH